MPTYWRSNTTPTEFNMIQKPTRDQRDDQEEDLR